MKSQAPLAIRAQIDLQTYANADILRDTMVGYVQLQLAATTTYGGASSSSQGPQPLDIGAVWKGKSKGKGHDSKEKGRVKDKDNQKGTGKDQKGGKSGDAEKKAGNCLNWGKPGHYYTRDC